MLKQGMGLASCNNALGYWHYPGDVFKMHWEKDQLHWKPGENSFDFLFVAIIYLILRLKVNLAFSSYQWEQKGNV